MDSKKNVKLLVLLLVVVLGAALAFGMIPKEDAQGKLRGVNRSVQSGYTQTDDLIPSFQVGTRENLSITPQRDDPMIVPFIRGDYAATDDIINGSVSY